MERTISATNARIHFGELMQQIKQRQEVVIVERGGEPQVVLMSVTKYRNLSGRGSDGFDWKTLLKRAHAQIKGELGRRKLKPAADVIRELRRVREDELARVR
jgi:prevent-host-death family protein